MSSLQWVKVDKEHHPIVRVSTNNFGSNKKIQAIPLASNRPHTEDQIKKDKNGKERGKSKKKELPTHKKLPTNRTPSEVIPKMPKARFPNKDFPPRPTLWFYSEQLQKGGMSPSKRRRDRPPRRLLRQ
jgi:hypothetical protein